MISFRSIAEPVFVFTYKVLNFLFKWLVLYPLSLLFGFGVFIRGILYDKGIIKAKEFPVVLISVGNVSVGGTGKTPLAEFIIQYAKQRGWNPGYLSRGYGRKTKGYYHVDVKNHSIKITGDEALQVANKFIDVPVSVCENREIGIQNLIQNHGVDCIILDDAFQRRDIVKTLDIVAIDANRAPWLDRMLPLGRLREPMSAIKRADLVVVNKILEEDKIRSFEKRISQKIAFTQIIPTKLRPFNTDESEIGVDNKHKRICVLFSGIGNNEQFYLEVSRLGVMVMRAYRFRDHHNYRPSDIKKVVQRFKRLKNENFSIEPPLIITTEKDYFRLKSQDWFIKDFMDYPFYYLIITLDVIRGSEAFYNTFDKVLPSKK